MSTTSGLSEGSQSTSRRRRPGTSKTRLAKAKEIEKQALEKKGWHETIQAAATTANRVWEAENGWTDYKNGEDDMDVLRHIGDHAETPEKRHSPLHVAASNFSYQSAHSAAASPSCVAFTAASEERQKSALNEASQGKSGRGTPYSNAVLARGRRTAKPLTVTCTRKSTMSRQSLVHSKPTITRKTRNQDGEALEDPCWPYPQRKKRGDSTTPLLNYVPKGEKARTKPNTKSSEQPPLPPQIERLSRAQPAQPGAGEQYGKGFHSLPLEQTRGARQNASTAKSLNKPLLSPLRGRWVESMKKATAPLAKEGHRWDPKNGFANVHSTDLVSFQHLSRSSPPPVRSQRQGQQLQQTFLSNSPAVVLERMIAQRRKNDPPGRKESERSSLRALAANLYECGNHGTPSEGHLHQSVVRTDESQSTLQEQIEVVMFSNSSVSDFLHGKGCDKYDFAALNFEEEEDYLLHSSVLATPKVAVEKENVGKDELGLFPAKATAAASTWRSGRYGERSSREGLIDKQGHTNVQVRSGRVTGPVDADEVQSLSWRSREISDDASNVWNLEMFEDDSFLQSSLSPNRKQKRKLKVKRNNSRHESWQFLLLQQQVRSKNEANFECTEVVNPKESKCATFGELMATKTWSKSRLKESSGACMPVGSQRSMSPGRGGKAGILRTSACQVAAEIASEDGSQLSSQSSLALSQGWKSFLKKKVNRESAAAGPPLQNPHQENKTHSKEEKIEKTVSFASDSDSLLHDSIFDFSYPELLQSSNITGRRSSEEKASRVNAKSLTVASQHGPAGPLRLTVPLELPSRRINQHSFGTDVSPLTSHNEEKECHGQESEPSFFQRLVECRQPTTHPVHTGAGQKQKTDGDKEQPLAYQLYLQSRKAAETVEEMMEVLQTKKISGCSSFRHDNGVKLKQCRDYGAEGTRSKDPEKAALEQARAKVEAMVETFYYTGRNGAPEEAPTNHVL